MTEKSRPSGSQAARYAIAFVVLGASLAAQGPPAFMPGFGMRGANGPVSALETIVENGSEVVYAGGPFVTVDGAVARGAARFDGTSWSGLGGGLPFGSEVKAVARFDDGTGPAIFYGGRFQPVASGPSYGVARFDGSSWLYLGTMSGAGTGSMIVEALRSWDDGSGSALYVGGSFTSIEGVTGTSGFARYDGASWSAVGSLGANTGTPVVRTLEIHDDGLGPALYVGGRFDTAGGVASPNVARWNGSLFAATGFAAVGAGIPGEEVLALKSWTRLGVPELYAGGGLLTGILRMWNGTVWSTIGSPLGSLATTIEDLEVWSDGTGPALYLAVGTIGVSGPIGLSRYDGTTLASLPTGLTNGANAVAGWTGASGSRLYVGGNFTAAGPASASHLAAWNGLGLETVGTGQGLLGTPWASAVFDDGSGPALYVGNVQAAGGLPGGGAAVARWTPTAGWVDAGAGVNSLVRDFEVFDDGTGPALHAAAGGGVVRWTGTGWSSIGVTSAGFGVGSVHDLLSWDDGSGPALYATGRFTGISGTIAANIARWNGAGWSPVSSGLFVGSGAEVGGFAMAVLPDPAGIDRLVVGGRFQSGGALMARLVNGIWYYDATLTSAGTGQNDIVRTLLRRDDPAAGPRLFIGGHFAGPGGLLHAASWDGGVNYAPIPGGPVPTGGVAAPTTQVHGFIEWDDGSGRDLIMGGRFTLPGAAAPVSLARIQASTVTAIPGLERSDGVAADARSLSVFDDGSGPSLYVLGDSRIAGGVASTNIARLGPWSPSAYLDQPAPGAGISLTVIGAPPLSDVFNLVSVVPCATPGTGPWFGLCGPMAPLLNQASMPLGTAPFHVQGFGTPQTYGPYVLPAGLMIETVTVAVLGPSVWGVSPVRTFTVQ